MRSCYQTIAISACFDLVTSIGYTRHFLATPNWTSLYSVSVMLWKIVISLGLYRIAEHFIPRVVQQCKDDDKVNFRLTFAQACGRMAKLWRQSTRVVLGGVILHLCRLFGFTWKAPSIAASMLVLAFGLAPLQDSHIIDLNKAGSAITSSLTSCTIAVFLEAVCTTPLSLVFDKSLGTAGKLMLLSGIHTPFITASLLWKMRRALKAVLHKIQQSGNMKGVEQPFWDAQTRFYEKLQSLMFWEMMFKVLMIVVNIVRETSVGDWLSAQVLSRVKDDS